jgi:hypothetical protein
VNESWEVTKLIVVGAIHDGASCNRLEYDILKPAFRIAAGYSPRKAGFNSWAVHVKLLVDKSGTEMGFSSGI